MIQAAQNVDLKDPVSEHVVALDGLAVVVNASNPIAKLTLAQIAQIFAGEITNWRDVKGRNKSQCGNCRSGSSHPAACTRQ